MAPLSDVDQQLNTLPLSLCDLSLLTSSVLQQQQPDRPTRHLLLFTSFCPQTQSKSSVVSRTSGVLFPAISCILLLLFSGLAHVAAAANGALERELLQSREMIEREIALHQYKERFREFIENDENDDDVTLTSSSSSRAEQKDAGRPEKSLKMPESLRTKLENEVNEWNSERDEAKEMNKRDDREMRIEAKSDSFVHPVNGVQPGFSFHIPDKVPHNSIERAVLTFENLPEDVPFTLLFTSNESKSNVFSWPVKRASNCSISSRIIKRCRYTKIELQTHIEEILFTSGNLQSAFKLRFFLINDAETKFITYPNRTVLRLRYSLPSRNTRQIKYLTRECTSHPMETCCLVKSNVTLKELGWENKISIPSALSFNYCRGSCTGTSDHYTTQNALIRQEIASRHKHKKQWSSLKRDAFQSCCAPYSYSDLIAYSRGAPGVFNRRILKDAIVTECACV